MQVTFGNQTVQTPREIYVFYLFKSTPKLELVYFFLIGSLFFSTVSLSQNRTIIQFGNGEIKIIGYYSETLEVLPQGKENVQVKDIGYSIGGGGYIYIRIDPVGYKTIMQINIGYSSHRALTGKITVEPSVLTN